MKCTHDGVTYYFTSWMDNKPVHMLHTLPTYRSVVTRNTKDNVGHYLKQEIEQPTIISEYNGTMGGTDKQDQLASYYRFEHRTLRWPHRFIVHFNMSSAINACILFKDFHNKPDLELIEYLKSLLQQLSPPPIVESLPTKNPPPTQGNLLSIYRSPKTTKN
jgi:hypothetical protein